MTCPCTVNPDEHACTWVLPWQAAALVARPIETIHTWRKSGAVGGRQDPTTKRWEVCCCEALSRSEVTAARWVKSRGRSMG